jgi:ketosteroid isomerase-like protein
MWIRRSLIAFLLLSPAVSDAQEVSPPEALLDRHIDAFNRADAEALASLYSEDARVVTADGRVVRGRREIERFWRSEQRAERRRIRLGAAEQQTSGGVSYAIGNYSFTRPSQRGTFTICFKRTADGSWKIVASMWNESWSVGYAPLQ